MSLQTPSQQKKQGQGIDIRLVYHQTSSQSQKPSTSLSNHDVKQSEKTTHSPKQSSHTISPPSKNLFLRTISVVNGIQSTAYLYTQSNRQEVEAFCQRKLKPFTQEYLEARESCINLLKAILPHHQYNNLEQWIQNPETLRHLCAYLLKEMDKGQNLQATKRALVAIISAKPKVSNFFIQNPSELQRLLGSSLSSTNITTLIKDILPVINDYYFTKWAQNLKECIGLCDFTLTEENCKRLGLQNAKKILIMAMSENASFVDELIPDPSKIKMLLNPAFSAEEILALLKNPKFHKAAIDLNEMIPILLRLKECLYPHFFLDHIKGKYLRAIVKALSINKQFLPQFKPDSSGAKNILNSILHNQAFESIIITLNGNPNILQELNKDLRQINTYHFFIRDDCHSILKKISPLNTYQIIPVLRYALNQPNPSTALAPIQTAKLIFELPPEPFRLLFSHSYATHLLALLAKNPNGHGTPNLLTHLKNAFPNNNLNLFLKREDAHRIAYAIFQKPTLQCLTLNQWTTILAHKSRKVILRKIAESPSLKVLTIKQWDPILAHKKFNEIIEWVGYYPSLAKLPSQEWDRLFNLHPLDIYHFLGIHSVRLQPYPRSFLRHLTVDEVEHNIGKCVVHTDDGPQFRTNRFWTETYGVSQVASYHSKSASTFINLPALLSDPTMKAWNVLEIPEKDYSDLDWPALQMQMVSLAKSQLYNPQTQPQGLPQSQQLTQDKSYPEYEYIGEDPLFCFFEKIMEVKEITDASENQRAANIQLIRKRVAFVTDFVTQESFNPFAFHKLRPIIDLLIQGGQECPDRAMVFLEKAHTEILFYKEGAEKYFINILSFLFKRHAVEMAFFNPNHKENLETVMYHSLRFNALLGLGLHGNAMLYDGHAQKVPRHVALGKILSHITPASLINFIVNHPKFLEITKLNPTQMASEKAGLIYDFQHDENRKKLKPEQLKEIILNLNLIPQDEKINTDFANLKEKLKITKNPNRIETLIFSSVDILKELTNSSNEYHYQAQWLEYAKSYAQNVAKKEAKDLLLAAGFLSNTPPSLPKAKQTTTSTTSQPKLSNEKQELAPTT